MARRMCPRCGVNPTTSYRCVPCGDIDRAAAKVRRNAREEGVRQRRAERIALGIDTSRKLGTPERKLRAAAWRYTKAAVENGFLLNPKACKCTDCSKQAECYDHRDYTKPMDVEPVCLGCNSKRRWGFMPPQVVHFIVHADPAERPAQAA